MESRFDLCLIGERIAASPSGAMQEAALRATGRTGSYEIVDVAAAALPAVLRDLRAQRWRGANVTMPHKRSVAAACDQLEGDAQRAHAVNTIVVGPDGRLIGANTDAVGFEMGLRASQLWPQAGCSAVVIGAGGAAAAVVLALSRAPASRITVVARRLSSARALIDDVGDQIGSELTAVSWDADLDVVLATADIVVNATSAGLAQMPFTASRLPVSCTVADVRYRPRPVDVVAAARQAGRRSCDGVEMLLHQGMSSFQRWTGDEPPMRAARVALEEALAG